MPPMLPLGAPMAIYACSDCYVCRRYRDLQAAAKLQGNKQKAGTSKTRKQKVKRAEIVKEGQENEKCEGEGIKKTRRNIQKETVKANADEWARR